MEQVRAGEITNLLLEMGAGDERAADVLVPLVYEELKQIASRQLRREGPGHTLGVILHDYIRDTRLVDQRRAQWVNRAQFFAVAARLMRRILLDHARKVRAGKRGGGWQRLELEAADVPIEERAEELIALDDALTRLATLNPRLSQVVECRFFGGMTEEETAAALGVTDRTVRRDWVKAKGWLHQELPAVM